MEHKNNKESKMKKQAAAMKMMVMKPMFRLSSSELPALKNWEVGEEYNLLVKVRQVGKHVGEMHEEEEGEQEGFHGEFEILKAKPYEREEKEKK